MNRKRVARKPALILLNDVRDVPEINYIEGPEYLIGRCEQANLTILQQYVSRKHCFLKHDAETDKWCLISLSRKAVSVRGKDVKTEESITLDCGDKIKISPLLVFEFKCSPDTDLKCCQDYKKMKLSDSDNQEEKTEIIPSKTTNILNDDVVSSDTMQLPASPEMQATVPISQIPDSSNFNDNFPDTEALSKSNSMTLFDFNYPDSFNGPDTLFQDEFRAIPETDKVTDTNSLLSIDDLESIIRKYLDSFNSDIYSQYGNDDDTHKQKLEDELNYRLKYLRKLDEFSSFCDSHFWESNDNSAVIVEIKNLSSFFKNDYSLLSYRNELILNDNQDPLNRIILNLDGLLMNKTKSVMQFVHKFFELSFKNKTPGANYSSDNFPADVINSKSNQPCNNEEYEKLVRSKNELEVEIQKCKDNSKWQEARIQFLEMKVKGKEQLEIELENLKEETVSMENKFMEMKRSLANMEIMELEYKCLLETNKHREEDKRSKDALERTINTLDNQVKELKEENGQLVADKLVMQDEISKLKQKVTELEDKLTNKTIAATGNVPKCSSSGGSEEEYCCDMVKEIKASMIDLMEREFQCSICGEMLIESTVTSCNHVFCSFCLQEWKKNQKRCPFCRANLVKEVKASIVDEYITGFLRLISDEMYTDRLKVIEERIQKKVPVQSKPKPRNTRRGRQNVSIVDLSGI